MAATADQIAEVRRMVGEPTADTYSDATIQAYIERYPLMDECGEEPYTWDTSTSPPTQDANDDWIATYDLHAAAADIWGEKAAAVAPNYSYSADGHSLQRSLVYEQYRQEERKHLARRVARSITVVKYPPESDGE